MNIQPEMLLNSSIILQRILSSRLERNTCKRNLSDFQSFGSGEESHVQRVIVKTIDQSPFFDHQIIQVFTLGFNSASHPDGTGSYYHNVIWILHTANLKTFGDSGNDFDLESKF